MIRSGIQIARRGTGAPRKRAAAFQAKGVSIAVALEPPNESGLVRT